jgi:transposase
MERGRHRGSGRHDPCPGDGRQLPPQPGFDDGSRSCLGCRRKRGTREQAFGRSRGGFTCKVHCLSDARGIPLVFHLTPGEAADCTAFEEVIALAEERPAYLLADKGYDSGAIRASLHEAGIRSCIPPKTNRKAKIRWNRRMYRERNRIERMIGHLKINRAIATRYDKLARSFLDALHIAAIRRCLRYATL